MNYAFTMVSNMLRDDWAPLIGTDACWLAYTIISYSGDTERGARLSSRYFRQHLHWTDLRADAAKTALLTHYGQIFSRVEGVKETSTPETWWVDLDQLSDMHEAFVVRLRTAKAQKRGPGRPKKPTLESGAGFSESEKKPTPESGAGFSITGGLFGKNLRWNPGQGYAGFRGTPTPESGAHKEEEKGSPEKEREEERKPHAGYGLPAYRPSSFSNPEGPTPQTHEGLRNQAAPPAPEDRPPHPGGAAHAAAPGSPQKPRDGTPPPARQDGQATGSEQVPGAAAARAVGVEALTPVPREELVARTPAGLGGAAVRALEEVFGSKLQTYLGEDTRTTGLPREDWWVRLTPAEIALVKATATAEHEAAKTARKQAVRTGRTGADVPEVTKQITLLIRGMDQLVSSVAPAVTPAGQASKAPKTRVGDGVEGPKDLSHLDPKLAVGARCEVNGQLGVVESAGNANYVVRRDDGEPVTVDRHVAAQLQALKPSDAPRPEASAGAADAPVQRATWRRVTGKGGPIGEEVQVEASTGGRRKLSTGQEISILELQQNYEQVS